MNLILAELLVSLYGIPMDFLASLQGGQTYPFEKTNNSPADNLYLGVEYFACSSSTLRLGTIFARRQRNEVGINVFACILHMNEPHLKSDVSKFPNPSCAPSWSFASDRSYNLFLFSLGFFLPLFIIISTSISVVRTIKHVRGCTNL